MQTLSTRQDVTQIVWRGSYFFRSLNLYVANCYLLSSTKANVEVLNEEKTTVYFLG